MSVRNQSFLIIIYIFLFSSPINAESRVSELNRILLQDSENILPLNENRFLTWDKNKVNLDNIIVYRETEGQIVNVISNSNNTSPAAALIINNLDQEGTFSIRLLGNDGRINTFEPMNKPGDVGIPKILFTNSELLLLKPEEQLIQAYDFNGLKSGEFYLYNEISWDHEKQILPARDVQNNLYFLGMKSADLKNSQNISLFKIEGEPILLADLPLTIPYYFSISDENISAIIGTKSISDKYQQKPFLIFVDNNQTIIDHPIELKTLPRKTIWFKDKLFLIHREYLLIYGTDVQSPPQKIKLISKIYPFDAFTNDESIFIVSGNGIGVGQNGNYYNSIELVEYDNTTHSVVIHPLQDGPISNVEYFPTADADSFYLRLDNLLIQFYITK